MLHKNIAPEDNHAVYTWAVADEAARLALSVTSTDVGKLAWQQDDDSFWVLTSATPTWVGMQGILTETDPIFNAWDKSTGISVTESQISDFGSYALTSHNHDTTYSAAAHDHAGVYEPADATILKDADIGVTVEQAGAAIAMAIALGG